MSYSINDEVYYSGFTGIYVISANAENRKPVDGIELDIEKWDYLISPKGGRGYIPVKENLIRKIS